MKMKILLKYIIIYISFIGGIIMFSLGFVNLISSLLVFLGGYLAIKNTFDYRMVRKNIKRYKNEDNKENNYYLDNKRVVNTSIIKKRNIRVRKREKK